MRISADNAHLTISMLGAPVDSSTKECVAGVVELTINTIEGRWTLLLDEDAYLALRDLTRFPFPGGKEEKEMAAAYGESDK
jgi:hypothetical protein